MPAALCHAGGVQHALAAADADPSPVLLSEDLRFRGLVHQASHDEVFAQLDAGRLTAYIGFDPTATSLHVGSLLQLCNLRRLQLAGNRPIALAGGGTGLIGDPGGKSEERPLLTRDELAANLTGIRPQLERFLDFSPGAGRSRALLLDNAAWLDSVPLLEFLREVGKHFTINEMVAKESVRSRIERPEQGISYTEFSYMLLQAYDYQHLFDTEGCRLQMGASDQWGNITAGIELIRKTRGERAYALTSPLVTKPDGTKFGKTESGALWLDAAMTSPYALYQYFVRTEDSIVGTYLRYFTFLDHEQLLALDEATSTAPQRREAQAVLAREVTTLVHGESETARVERAVAALYGGELDGLDAATLEMVTTDAPTSSEPRGSLEGEGFELVSALVQAGLVPSRSAARTTISQGGAYLNNVRVADETARVTAADLIAGRYVLLRRGRRDFHILRFD
ncbi:MAG TPA: tyrosine--tRNA ligase [Acidimicrobiales bacterium]|nr:tyrosine--tRNA ligase [Acidimicrobiales bacterium]